MNILRNRRKSKGKTGAAVIGLCAWKQEKYYFRMLGRLYFKIEMSLDSSAVVSRESNQ